MQSNVVWQMTLDTYSNVTPGLQKAAAQRFEYCLQAIRSAESKNKAYAQK